MKLKIETRVYSATIGRKLEGSYVALGELMEILPETESIPEGSNLGPHAKKLSQWNEAKKNLKLALKQVGESFTIQQKYIVKDEEGQEDTIIT